MHSNQTQWRWIYFSKKEKEKEAALALYIMNFENLHPLKHNSNLKTPAPNIPYSMKLFLLWGAPAKGTMTHESTNIGRETTRTRGKKSPANMEKAPVHVGKSISRDQSGPSG